MIITCTRIFLAVLAAVGLAWAAHTACQGPFALERSVPGRVVRFVLGSAGLAQDVDDLADELSLPANAAALRAWAAEVLAAQRERPFPASSVHYGWLVACAAAPDIAPPAVLAGHHAVVGSVTPKTYLHVDAAGRAAAVVLSWANLRVGLVVLPGGSAPALHGGAFHQRQPAADIRVFSSDS